MRDLLAERLLAQVMGWSPEDVARERPDLQALATFKYDEYQQFSPGMRFVESLALWLNQFQNDQERQQAYAFIRSRLVFISSAEMAHLVSMAYPDFIRPLILNEVATRLGHPDRLVVEIYHSPEFRVLQRQSMFLGLSDGARIDLFRRSNPEISHEQVWLTYEMPDTKADEMVNKLGRDLEEILSRVPSESERKFRSIFLLDDFSGSGLSYIRKREGDAQYNGKIHKVFESLIDGELRNIVDLDEVSIGIVLCVATANALSHIREHTNHWLKQNGFKRRCSVQAIQVIPSAVQIDSVTDKDILTLLERYFDPDIISKSFSTGNTGRPYLGFDECALVLVLSHNTPNNTIPLLWFEETSKYRGLFPRVNRHKS